MVFMRGASHGVKDVRLLPTKQRAFELIAIVHPSYRAD